MAKPSELLMDGEVFNPDNSRPALLKLREFLDKCPKNEVFSVDKMREMAKCGDGTVRDFIKKEQYSAYSHRHGARGFIWIGNPKGIELLKKTLAERAN